jgi:hypothetical protein
MRGNIISFQVYIDSSGTLMTELSRLPLKNVNDIFKEHERPYIEKVLKETYLKLEGLHDYLEKELQTL